MKTKNESVTVSEQMLRSWNGIGKRLVELAEAFPEDDYDYRPAPEVFTFAQQLLHITAANQMTAARLKGGEFDRERLFRLESRSPAKAEVAAGLKQSFSAVAALIELKGDAAVIPMIGHCNAHYGQLVVYYRLKGLTPPFSQRGKP